MGRRVRGRFDPISVIEAAYSLEPDEGGWLTGVATALSPALDRSYGVIAGTFFLGGEQTRYGTRVGVGVPAEVLQAGDAGPDIGHLLEALFSHPGSFHSMTSSMPSLFRLLQSYVPFIEDTVGLIARRTSRDGVFLSSVMSEKFRLTRRSERLYDRIAAHVEAGYRLRAAIGSELGGAPTEAVFTGDGRCLHADGAAESKCLRDRLRDAVRAMDRARGRERSAGSSEAVELWPALVAARWSLVDQFESDGKRFVVAVKNPVSDHGPRALSEGERAVVHHISIGRTPDETAYALGLGTTTVYTHLRHAMRKLGTRSRSDLMLLRGSASRLESFPGVADMAFAGNETCSREPSAAITPAERDVLARVVRGESNARIARARGVAYRTVANQVASLLRKYGVRDRQELAAAVGAARLPR